MKTKLIIMIYPSGDGRFLWKAKVNGYELKATAPLESSRRAYSSAYATITEFLEDTIF